MHVIGSEQWLIGPFLKTIQKVGQFPDPRGRRKVTMRRKIVTFKRAGRLLLPPQKKQKKYAH